MKLFGRLSLKIFSLIIFVLSAIIILITIGIVDANFFTIILNEVRANDLASKIVIIISTIFLLISAKYIIFKIGRTDNSMRDGIVLENSNGKLVISRESLENMILSSARRIYGVTYEGSRTELDDENRLVISVNISVADNAIVKNVSKELQECIKNTMKDSADLEVATVSINVKNIVASKEKFDKKSKKFEKVTEEIKEEKE